MTLKAVIMLLTLFAFSLCTVLFVIRLASAARFRQRIAIPRDFAEGSATGLVYKLWIFSYGMLFVQCTSFILFPLSEEITLNLRLIIYTVNLIIFFILRSNTLPLLGVWFGKTGIWVNHGETGLIKFENILHCEILGKKTPDASNPKAMCSVVFYTDGRYRSFRRRKFVFRIAASDIAPYFDRLSIKTSSSPEYEPFFIPVKNRIIGALSYLSGSVFIIGLVCFILSLCILSPYRYNEYPEASATEIVSFAPITEVVADQENNLLFVRYAGIEAVNVYSETDGAFKWSVSRATFPAAASAGISVSNSILRYTVNGEARYFDCVSGAELSADSIGDIEFPKSSGNSVFFDELTIKKQLSDGSWSIIVARSQLYSLFIPSVSWDIMLSGLIALYICRSLALFFASLEEKKRVTEQETLSSLS